MRFLEKRWPVKIYKKGFCPFCGGALAPSGKNKKKKCLTCCFCPRGCGYVDSPGAPGPCGWCDVLAKAARPFGGEAGEGR